MSDYFSKRYGLKTGLVTTIIIIIWLLLATIVQFIAGASILTAISGMNYVYAILLIGIVVLIYSFLGGFQAVVKTDVFQYLLFIVLLFVVAFSVSQGRVLDYSSIIDIQDFGIGKLLAFFVIGLTFAFTAPEVWQRAYAAKDDKTIRKGLILSAFLMVIAIAAVSLIGLSARAAFTDIRPEEAVIKGITDLLPTQLIGIGLVLFFAVIMSTIDTELFVLANNFSKDIWINFINNKADHLKLTKIGLVLAALISILVSLFFQDILVIALAFLSIGMSFAPIIIGSFYFNLKPGAIKLGLIAALISIFVLLFAGYITPETSMISLPVCFVFLLIGQVIFKKK